MYKNCKTSNNMLIIQIQPCRYTQMRRMCVRERESDRERVRQLAFIRSVQAFIGAACEKNNLF